MKKLVLLRHGESAWNKENRFTGWTDVDLSERGMIEAKKTEMRIKGKSVVKPMGIYKREAGTVKKTKSRGVELSEYLFCACLNCQRNSQHIDFTVFNGIHECYSSMVTFTSIQQGICLSKDIIGCEKPGFMSVQLLRDLLGRSVACVVGNGGSIKCTRIDKNFHNGASLYRYAS